MLRGAATGTMKLCMAIAAMVGLLPWTGVNAQQQAASTTFRVTAQVQAGCEMTALDATFDTPNVQSNQSLKGATPLLRAICTPDSTYRIAALSAALSGASGHQRAGADNLLLNSSATGTGTGMAQEIGLPGPIAATRFNADGDYANTVTVRIYY
jgi:spore coat protein U-like protein